MFIGLLFIMLIVFVTSNVSDNPFVLELQDKIIYFGFPLVILLYMWVILCRVSSKIKEQQTDAQLEGIIIVLQLRRIARLRLIFSFIVVSQIFNIALSYKYQRQSLFLYSLSYFLKILISAMITFILFFKSLKNRKDGFYENQRKQGTTGNFYSNSSLSSVVFLESR